MSIVFFIVHPSRNLPQSLIKILRKQKYSTYIGYIYEIPISYYRKMYIL